MRYGGPPQAKRPVETAPVVWNPCTDTLYLRLQNRPVAQLSDREFELYARKDAACDAYESERYAVEVQERIARSTRTIAIVQVLSFALSVGLLIATSVMIAELEDEL